MNKEKKMHVDLTIEQMSQLLLCINFTMNTHKEIEDQLNETEFVLRNAILQSLTDEAIELGMGY